MQRTLDRLLEDPGNADDVAVLRNAGYPLASDEELVAAFQDYFCVSAESARRALGALETA